MFFDRYIKRALDFLFSFFLIILLFPVFLLIIISIKLDSRGSFFFTQNRVGKNGISFRVFKFRSMMRFEDSFNLDGSEMENQARVTRVGKVLRRYSFDELPQLLNILLGQMSFVGPRPALRYQVEKYTKLQRKRLLVRPGLTGLAQVNGRNALTWNEKIALDLQYISEISLVNDLKIIFKTFHVVLQGEDVIFVKHDEISKHDKSVLTDVGMKGD